MWWKELHSDSCDASNCILHCESILNILNYRETAILLRRFLYFHCALNVLRHFFRAGKMQLIVKQVGVFFRLIFHLKVRLSVRKCSAGCLRCALTAAEACERIPTQSLPILICSCILSVITWVFTKEASDLAMMKWVGIDGIISDKTGRHTRRNTSSGRWFTLVLTAPCLISFME